MLTGSRLGAAFVVLVTAAIFALRAGEGQRKAPVTCAMFALFATAMIYIPAAFIGGARVGTPSTRSSSARPRSSST